MGTKIYLKNYFFLLVFACVSNFFSFDFFFFFLLIFTFFYFFFFYLVLFLLLFSNPVFPSSPQISSSSRYKNHTFFSSWKEIISLKWFGIVLCCFRRAEKIYRVRGNVLPVDWQILN